ncbi:MAG: antibiotic biosynthesis monooxygenase [Bryobacterales bacterium]|nr:antibiotic biosynthesis monooxygenase [Bryobacterales bacterium]
MAELLTVVAEFQAKEGKETEARAALLALVEPTRAENGCVQYDLHTMNDRPGHFLFYELWNSRAELDRHAASAHLTMLGAKIPNLFVAPPRVDLFTRIA